MLQYLVKRLLFAVPTLLAVLTVVFFIARVLPGDPAQVILGEQASAEAIQALRVRLGLDRPLVVQYGEFMAGALTGDWGSSMVTGRPVLGEVLNVIPYTIELTLAAVLLGAAIGVPLGVWSALHRNRFIDYATRIGSLLGLSFPAFVMAVMLLLVFARSTSRGSRSSVPAAAAAWGSGCCILPCRPSISASSWPPISPG